MEHAQPPGRRTVMIRELDVDTWATIRGEAVRRRWTTAAVLEHVVREWLSKRDGLMVAALRADGTRPLQLDGGRGGT